VQGCGGGAEEGECGPPKAVPGARKGAGEQRPPAATAGGPTGLATTDRFLEIIADIQSPLPWLADPAKSVDLLFYVLCMWYLCVMYVVLMCYVRGTYVLCTWYLCVMYVVLMCYVRGTYVLCTWYLWRATVFHGQLGAATR